MNAFCVAIQFRIASFASCVKSYCFGLVFFIFGKGEVCILFWMLGCFLGFWVLFCKSLKVLRESKLQVDFF